jgi:hypothetical protein
MPTVEEIKAAIDSMHAAYLNEVGRSTAAEQLAAWHEKARERYHDQLCKVEKELAAFKGERPLLQPFIDRALAAEKERDEIKNKLQDQCDLNVALNRNVGVLVQERDEAAARHQEQLQKQFTSHRDQLQHIIKERDDARSGYDHRALRSNLESAKARLANEILRADQLQKELEEAKAGHEESFHIVRDGRLINVIEVG